MKNITVTFSETEITPYLENSISVTGLKHIDKDEYYDVITTPNTCIKFFDKVVETLKVLSTGKNFFNYYQIITESGLFIDHIDIVRIPETKPLFLTFEKLGIPVSKLSIEISGDGNNIYIPNIILKNIERLNNTQRIQIVMYLLSLTKLFKAIVTSCVTVKYSKLSNTLNISPEDLDRVINNFLYSFKGFDTKTITLSQIVTEDYKSYGTLSNPYKVRMPIINKEATESFNVKYKAIKFNADDKIKYALILNYGIDVFFIQREDYCLKIYHTNSSCYLSFDGDILHNIFIQSSDDNVHFIKRPKILDTYTNFEYIELEDSPFEKYVENLLQFFKNINEGICPDTETRLGITIKKSSSVTCNLKDEYKDDPYAQELYKQVLPYYETFDLKDLEPCLKGFANPNGIYAMLFVGDTGTGKSTAAKVIPIRCGMPFVSVNFSTNLEESDIIGTMIPNPTKSSADDPEFIWQDGILTKAVRNGYVFNAEEINFARPGVLSKLNSLLDEYRQIDLPTGEIVKAHKNFRLIATCNISYEGTNRFNKALINRFEIIHIFKELEKEEMFKVIEERTGYNDKTKMNNIYTVYEAIKKYSKEQNLDVKISLRQMLNLFTKGKFYKNAEQAIKDLLINGAFIEDEEYKDYFENTILKAFDLSFKI